MMSPKNTSAEDTSFMSSHALPFRQHRDLQSNDYNYRNSKVFLFPFLMFLCFYFFINSFLFIKKILTKFVVMFLILVLLSVCLSFNILTTGLEFVRCDLLAQCSSNSFQ